MILNALQTAHALHYGALADEIAALLQDASVHVPQRMVLPCPAAAIYSSCQRTTRALLLPN